MSRRLPRVRPPSLRKMVELAWVLGERLSKVRKRRAAGELRRPLRRRGADGGAGRVRPDAPAAGARAALARLPASRALPTTESSKTPPEAQVSGSEGIRTERQHWVRILFRRACARFQEQPLGWSSVPSRCTSGDRQDAKCRSNMPVESGEQLLVMLRELTGGSYDMADRQEKNATPFIYDPPPWQKNLSACFEMSKSASNALALFCGE